VKLKIKSLTEEDNEDDVLKQMQQIDLLHGFHQDIVGKDYMQKNFRV